ncbi:MAG: hypothetical protein Fur0043_25820 [Anaerolineales bacterium]
MTKIAHFQGVLYLVASTPMNMLSPIPRLLPWIALVALALTSLALAFPFPQVQETLAMSGEAAPATSLQTDVGSTDGIVLMAIIIVLIILLPILLRRRDWENGKRKK